MIKSWMKVKVVGQVAHKKRERTRQQASELKEMQKFLLIKANRPFFHKPRCHKHFTNIKKSENNSQTKRISQPNTFLIIKVSHTNVKSIPWAYFEIFPSQRRWRHRASTLRELQPRRMTLRRNNVKHPWQNISTTNHFFVSKLNKGVELCLSLTQIKANLL